MITITLGCSKLGGNYLDETYFPLGENYEWVYERMNHLTDEDGEYTDFDTVRIKVASIEDSSGWTVFKLEDTAFVDVGEEVMIGDNRVLVFGGVDTIPLVPPEDFKLKESVTGYGVGYRGDTLMLSHYVGGGYVLMVYSSERLKGVGVIRQEGEFRSPPYYEGYIDWLLYFVKGEDTVYKCPESR